MWGFWLECRTLLEQGRYIAIFICFALGHVQQLKVDSMHGRSSVFRCLVRHCEPVTQSHCIGGGRTVHRTPRMHCTSLLTTQSPKRAIPCKVARWEFRVSACCKAPLTKSASTNMNRLSTHLYACFERCLLAGREGRRLPPGHVRAVYPADRREPCHGVAVLQQRAQRSQERDPLRVRGEPGVPARRARQVCRRLR